MIPCIDPSINTYVQSWVLAMHMMFESRIHVLQVEKVYSQMSTDAVHRSVYLPYTASIQRYTGAKVYRSTGIQSPHTTSIQSRSRMWYTVHRVYRVYRWYTVTIMVPV